MIGKISRGSRPGDIGRYLHGEGHLGEHVYRDERDRERPGGIVIGGNLAREGDTDERGWAADLRLAAQGRPDSQRPIWHASLRCAPGDRTLTDAEWRGAVEEIAQRMGWAEHPHVIVRHADDHVHVVMSRVGFDGAIWRGQNDARRLQEARQSVEKRLGLEQVPTRTQKRGREAAEGRLKPGEYRQSQRTGADPARVRLAERVERCVQAAEGMGRDVFEEALQRAGVRFEANVASTGRVSGYRFADSTDQAGEPVWFKASQLDRSLAWSRVGPRIEQVEAVRVDPVEVEPKRFFESKASHAQRVDEAQRATEAAEVEAVAAKREQRLAQAVPPRNVGQQIKARSAAQQRAEAYRQQQAERREWLAHIGRIRELREPEGGWKSLRQIEDATRKRASAPTRKRADAQVRTPSLSDYQTRQRQQRDALRQTRGPTR